MNTRRSTRNKITPPKRKHETETDSNSSDSNDTSVLTVIPKKNVNKQNKKSPKRKHESEDDSAGDDLKNAGNDDDGSSSDSSVGDYLKNPDEIDLSSSFFTSNINEKPPDFNTIEKKIFGGVQHLSDDSDESESSEIENDACEEPVTQTQVPLGKVNFTQLREYNKKIEEAKACVEKYEKNIKTGMKKSSENNQEITKNSQEITKLLKLGETKNEPQTTLNSMESDFDDTDDENKMEWQEIEESETTEDKINIPKEGVQITVELPQNIRKKTKGFDMMAAIKRRINRVKKENQVYVHKVHLLCWIAHGNYINSILNDTELLAPALSLLPSDKCYPPKHADMSYLEQIVKWFGKMIKVIPKTQNIPIKESLEKAISNKTAGCTRDFVLIFIIILRSLGLQCRLILSLQCLPLRPAASELCSLSSKETENNKKPENKASTSKTSNKTTSKEKPSKSGAKTAKPSNKSSSSKDKPPEKKKKKVERKKPVDKSNTQEKKTRSSTTRSSSKSSTKLKISQVDGADDEETIKKKRKPSLRIKLKRNLNDSASSTSELATINNKNKKLLDVEDADFKPKRRSPTSRSPKDINGNKKSGVEKTKSPSASTSELRKIKAEKSPIKSPKPSTSTPNNSPAKKLSEKLQLNKIKPEKNPIKSPKPSTSTTNKSPAIKLSEKLQLNKVKPEKNPVKTPKSSTSTPNNSPAKKISEKLQLNKLKTSPKSSQSTSSNYFNDKKSKNNVTNDIVKLLKGEMSQKRIAEQNLKLKTKVKKEDPDYDSDYFPDENEPIEKPIKKRKSSNYNSEDEFKFKINTNVKRNMKTKNEIDSRVLSSDDEAASQDSGKKKKIGNDVWVEVFLEEEEKWISVDLIKGQIHCVSELYSRASQPVSYILAWNNDLSLKDVTARYCPNWNTVTRKLRVDSVWWQDTLKPYLGVKNARDKEEDEDLARQQLDKPLPTTISEYKNHPLYALKRHLLKFEAIYPPNAVTLGFIRNEPVYARECVHTLHSREIWVKHAKVVKPAQEPYKIVKARPKYDKLTGNMITDLPLEIFGSWQVEDYVPPTAENGIVPRNAFGNVELFKACMLPKKTVHLQLPGLNKICRKLRIDCAPAVVGFDFHSGFSHPMFDGYVVCEEFKDTLIEAWEQDQIETAKKEQEKYDKRVWGNWRKLIKAALIRERLKARYDFGSVESSSSKEKGKKSKGTKTIFKKLKTCKKSDDEWTDVE